jgi:hypothetical protein
LNQVAFGGGDQVPCGQGGARRYPARASSSVSTTTSISSRSVLIGDGADGLEVQMMGPVDQPIESFVLPARTTRGTVLDDVERPSLLCYDRGTVGADGRWRYLDVNGTALAL